MKKFLLTVFAVCCAVVMCHAADAPSGWTTDIDAAFKTAARENKKVLVLFTGSDWCGWCKRLYKDVLNKGKFKKYAKEKLVLVYFDFPNKKKISPEQMKIQEQWRKKFGVSGYPTTVILSPKGKKLGTISGYCQLDDYIGKIQKAK